VAISSGIGIPGTKQRGLKVRCFEANRLFALMERRLSFADKDESAKESLCRIF